MGYRWQGLGDDVVTRWKRSQTWIPTWERAAYLPGTLVRVYTEVRNELPVLEPLQFAAPGLQRCSPLSLLFWKGILHKTHYILDHTLQSTSDPSTQQFSWASINREKLYMNINIYEVYCIREGSCFKKTNFYWSTAYIHKSTQIYYLYQHSIGYI